MLYILDEPSVIDATVAGQKHFVRSALAAVDRTERNLVGAPPSLLPKDGEYVFRQANFTADLMACIQLQHWETSGESRYLSSCLPKFVDALDDLKTRIRSTPEWFLRKGPSDSELFELVAAVRSKSFRFSPDLRAVLLATEPDEDALVEALAQLAFQVWQKRFNDGTPAEATPVPRSGQSSISPLEALALIPEITVRSY